MRWQNTVETCIEIDDLAEVHGCAVFFVVLPSLIQVDPELMSQYAWAAGFQIDEIDIDQPTKLLVQPMRDSGLKVIDTLEDLREAYRQDRSDLFGRVDTHFGPAGHALVADAVGSDSRVLAVLSTVTAGSHDR
jgi:hypothetical protein